MRNSKEETSPTLASSIKDRIKGKVAVVGIGNILRGDDGLGPRFIEMLKTRKPFASLFDCGTAPENYIFPILSSSCDTVILVDAADFGARPGQIRMLQPSEISKASFSTHTLSPILLIDLLKTAKEDMNILIISIQPKEISLGQPMSREVMASLGLLSDIFSEIV